MIKKKFTFKGTDNIDLMAELDLPDSKVNYYALFAPCFTCTKNLRAVKYITRSLNENGIALFRFDFPGLGESKGNFTDTSFSTNLENIRIAYKYMRDNLEAPELLIGHSLGGVAMIRLAMEFDSVNAIAIIASADNPSLLAAAMSKTRDQAKYEGFATTNIGGSEFVLTDSFFEDLYKNGKLHDLTKVTKPVLTMYSPDDMTIAYKYIIKNFTDTNGQNSYISLNNMGHLMEKPKDAQKVGNLISAWSKLYCS